MTSDKHELSGKLSASSPRLNARVIDKLDLSIQPLIVSTSPQIHAIQFVPAWTLQYDEWKKKNNQK